MKNTIRFEVLDSFRGVFALCVVVVHMNYMGSISEMAFFKGSYFFVEFFFVLSGFVLAHSYAFKKSLNFNSFFVSRVFRLMPLHLTMLSVFILIECGKMLAESRGMSFNSTPFSGSTALSELLPNILLLQSWTSLTDSMSFNFPSWSISIEFYMYFLFFFILLFKQSIRYLIWIIIAFSMLWLVMIENRFFTENMIRGLSCFFSGALTYLVFRHVRHKFIRSALLFSIIEAMLVASIIYIIPSDIDNKSFMITILFCLSVFTFSFEQGLVSTLLKCKCFIFLGKISYSIYMTHAAILFGLTASLMVLQKLTGMELAPMIDGERFLTFGDAWVNNLFLVVTLGFIIFISNITYRLIEQKGQHVGKKILNYSMSNVKSSHSSHLSREAVKIL
ncbi:MAG: acyltransferase [Methylococcales bacterium]|nr:acyltransferase [Methylococcales bacterium]